MSTQPYLAGEENFHPNTLIDGKLACVQNKNYAIHKCLAIYIAALKGLSDNASENLTMELSMDHSEDLSKDLKKSCHFQALFPVSQGS